MKKAVIIGAALLLAGAGGAAAQAPGDPAAVGDGKKAFESVCARCHSLDVPLSKVLTREQWETLVGDMVAKGAALSANERAAMVDYLTARSDFQTKCSSCHSLETSLDKKKAREVWLNTIERMVAKKPGLLTPEEQARVASYLFLMLGGE